MSEISGAPFETSVMSVATFDNGNGYLYEHSRVPGTVVRFSGEFDRLFLNPEDNLHDNLVGLDHARELFLELEEAYGIPTAGFMPVIGAHEVFGMGAYIVSRKIDGELQSYPATVSEVFPEHQKSAARTLFDRLSTYLTNKITDNEQFLMDIFGINQYVFENGQFVLVDMDPYFEEPEDERITLDARNNLGRLAQQVLTQEEFLDWKKHIMLVYEDKNVTDGS